MYRFFFIIFLAFFLGCKQEHKRVSGKEHKVKSIDFQELHLIDISEKAQLDIRNWKSFQALMQVIVNMAPTKIKNTESLVVSNPDSLLIYSRLYPLNKKTILENASVERDWRTIRNVKDTIFRLEKKSNSENSFIQWDKFLIENIPYMFSVFVKKTAKNQQMELGFISENQVIHKGYVDLDTIPVPHMQSGDLLINKDSINDKKLPSNQVTITYLPDDWREYQIYLIPEKSALYGIRFGFREDVQKNQNVIFHSPTLQIPAKDLYKVGDFSDKIVREDTYVESSYYSVFFWLRQIEDELKHLLAEDKFPEKINNLGVKARFRLFETQIKELTDNVKNNPNFQENEVEERIAEIEKTFNNIIARINHGYDNTLEEKMQFIHNQVDTTQKEPVSFPFIP